MAKTQTAKPNATQQKTDRQGRKKQAKREAKLMLKIEQAKKDVQKAEQKVARAQTNLEESRTQLRDLEQKLNEARASEQPETQTTQELQTRSPEAQHAQNNGTSSEDISVNGEKIQATGYSSTNEDQPLTQAESDTTSSPSSEVPDVIAQTDEPAPDDIALSEGNTPADDQAQHAARDIRLTEGDTPADDMGNTTASTEEETATTGTRRKRNSRRAHAAAEHKDEEKQ